MRLKPQLWLETLQDEYLRDFVKQGGAAVKFVVLDENTDYEELRTQLRRVAEQENFTFALVDAVSTKIHMIDKLFHEVARQVDWDGLSHSFVAKLFTENGYNLPPDPEDFSLRQIAQLNGREEKFLRKDLEKWIEERIYRDFELSQEFRIAMMRLCLDQPEGRTQGPILSDTIKDWIRGELRLISQLKEAFIFQKIGRHNARHMLFSLTHWLRMNGLSGLVLVLDISRYMVSSKSKDPDAGLFYSVPAVLDVYEVLRQFIDGTDEMEGCLIVVMAPVAFVNDDRRGLTRYDALKLRISDEVRDRHRPNPLSSLIRLSTCSNSL